VKSAATQTLNCLYRPRWNRQKHCPAASDEPPFSWIRYQIRSIQMKNLLALGLFLLLILGAPATFIHSQEAIRAKSLLEKDLNAYTGKNFVLTVGEITLPPGATGSRHRHPGPTFVYVLEGAVEIELEGAPPKVFRAGDSFYEDARQLHISTKNVSATEPARILAYHLSHKGEKLTEPEK